MTDPKASLAAFTTPGAADAINAQIEEKLKEPGVSDVAEKYRGGPRLVKHERCDYLRPTVFHSTNLDAFLTNTEYMFPCATVVECPQDEMIKRIGQTLVCTAITKNETWSQQLVDAVNIDRLNIGEVKTMQLHWMQPHEGNLIDFLFRARAFQNSLAAGPLIDGIATPPKGRLSQPAFFLPWPWSSWKTPASCRCPASRSPDAGPLSPARRRDSSAEFARQPRRGRRLCCWRARRRTCWNRCGANCSPSPRRCGSSCASPTSSRRTGIQNILARSARRDRPGSHLLSQCDRRAGTHGRSPPADP